MIEKHIYQVAFVISSKYRKIILDQLKDNPKTASILAKKNKWFLSCTSRGLLELAQKDLVQVLNSQDRQNRFYNLTELGLKVLLLIKELNINKLSIL